MDDQQFLDGLFEAVQKDADAALEKFSPEELGQFVRDFVRICSEFSPKHFDVDGDPLKAAASAIYLAKLFPLAFRASYTHTDKMMRAEESIRNALEDL